MRLKEFELTVLDFDQATLLFIDSNAVSGTSNLLDRRLRHDRLTTATLKIRVLKLKYWGLDPLTVGNDLLGTIIHGLLTSILQTKG